MSPRIMHVMWSFDIGGAETLVAAFLRRLKGSGFEPALCVLAEDGPLRTEMESLDIPVFRIKRTSVPANLCKVLQAFRRFKPDLIHAHNVGPETYGCLAGRLLRVPVLSTRHGRPDRKKSLRNTLTNRATQRFVAVSEDVRQLLMERIGIPDGKTCTIINGIDADRFQRPLCRHIRDELEIPADGFIFGSVGRLEPVKAPSKMLEALQILLHQNVNAYLVLAGDGRCRPELEEQIQRLKLGDHVRLLGARRDIPEVLSVFDVFLMSSISEGIPISLLEAMAAGRPAVCTRVGGIPEVIEHSVDGILVDPNCPHALADGMKSLMLDHELRKRLSGAARETVQRRFSLDAMVDAYCQQYDMLLNRDSCPNYHGTLADKATIKA